MLELPRYSLLRWGSSVRQRLIGDPVHPEGFVDETRYIFSRDPVQTIPSRT